MSHRRDELTGARPVASDGASITGLTPRRRHVRDMLIPQIEVAKAAQPNGELDQP